MKGVDLEDTISQIFCISNEIAHRRSTAYFILPILCVGFYSKLHSNYIDSSFLVGLLHV